MPNTTLSTIPKLIYQVLELEGIDAHQIFTHTQFDINSLGEKSDRVEMGDMFKLWDESAKASNNPCFGLLAASLFQPAYLKGIGFAWMASDTIGDGLTRLVKNISMINTAVQIDLIEKAPHVIMRYSPTESTETLSTQVHPCAIQLGLGFLLRMFRIATGRPIPASRIFVKHDMTANEKSGYLDFFACEIEDKAEFNGIEFEKSILDVKLPTADSELAAMNDKVVENYITNLKQPDIVQKVSLCVTPLLPNGCPTEAEIAVRLHMSRRTLQRKLSTSNTSFGKVLATLRNNIAKSHLSQEKISITEIAYLTGYSSPSTFSRAFKKDNGLTPNAYREQALN